MLRERSKVRSKNRLKENIKQNAVGKDQHNLDSKIGIVKTINMNKGVSFRIKKYSKRNLKICKAKVK